MLWHVGVVVDDDGVAMIFVLVMVVVLVVVLVMRALRLFAACAGETQCAYKQCRRPYVTVCRAERFDEAAAKYDEAYRIRVEWLGPKHMKVAET